MATKNDVSENCQEKTSFDASDREKDLQSIFRRLRVNNKPKKATSLQPRIKGTRMRIRSKSAGSLPDRRRKRKILRDPTFVFNRTHSKTSLTKKQCENTETTEINCPKEPLSQVDTHDSPARMQSSATAGTSDIQSRIQGCGEQFRNGVNIKVSDSLNMDDTTPEELAAYFDQLLHIPKDMSQMAEMMYT